MQPAETPGCTPVSIRHVSTDGKKRDLQEDTACRLVGRRTTAERDHRVREARVLARARDAQRDLLAVNLDARALLLRRR